MVVAIAAGAPGPAPEPSAEEPAEASTAPRQIAPEHGARLAMAEQAFDGGDLELAATLYRELCQLPERAVAAYACYRASWTERARGDHIQALELLLRLLPLLSPPVGGHEQRLRRVAVSDLPALYAQVGQASKAHAFFARYLEPSELGAALTRLAQHYEDDGKSSEAATVRAQIR